MSNQVEMEEETRPERRHEGESTADTRIMAILPVRKKPKQGRECRRKDLGR